MQRYPCALVARVHGNRTHAADITVLCVNSAATTMTTRLSRACSRTGCNTNAVLCASTP